MCKMTTAPKPAKKATATCRADRPSPSPRPKAPLGSRFPTETTVRVPSADPPKCPGCWGRTGWFVKDGEVHPVCGACLRHECNAPAVVNDLSAESHERMLSRLHDLVWHVQHLASDIHEGADWAARRAADPLTAYRERHSVRLIDDVLQTFLMDGFITLPHVHEPSGPPAGPVQQTAVIINRGDV